MQKQGEWFHKLTGSYGLIPANTPHCKNSTTCINAIQGLHEINLAKASIRRRKYLRRKRQGLETEESIQWQKNSIQKQNTL